MRKDGTRFWANVVITPLPTPSVPPAIAAGRRASLAGRPCGAGVHACERLLAAELIRERERTQHTPIIFISATSVDDQYIFKGYSLGAVDYLAKPADADDAIVVTEGVLEA